MKNSTEQEINLFIEKTKKFEKGEKLDLSSGEDLSIGIMNLISIEEHLFFSGGKTGKTKYFDMLHEVREMRKELMKKLIKNYEGEGWCIGKHLLAASMRIMEVGTKAQTKGETKEAYDLFTKSYDLYNLFWGFVLGAVDKNSLGKIDEVPKQEQPVTYERKDFLGKLSGIVGKVLDCCRE